jgi:caa(3)-type oxidase subunit IV
MAAHAQSPVTYDDADPHHESAHHGHVIIRPRTLVAVLAVLLVFTILTVFCSRFEVWAAHKFQVDIPQLVNVAICLSIAVVKSALVALFFMQLKYDTKLNMTIFISCLFAFSLFLFFSMTDLGTRAAVYSYKAGEIQPGGQGIDTQVKEGEKVVRGIDTGQKGIVAWARQRRIDQIGELQSQGLLQPALAPGETAEARWEHEASILRHTEHDTGPAVSTANRQVKPAPGPTPDLYKRDAELNQEGGEGHGGH